MKKRFSLLMLVASLSGGMYAQGEMDAFNLSYNDLTGTARSVGMGGAFGALGGDISGVAINPAGIGVYTKSEVVTSINFTNNKSKTDLLGSKSDDSKFKFSFDNIAFVGTLPTMSDAAPLVNFGFSYNRLKSFDRNIKLRGNALSDTQTGYIANRVGGIPQGYLGLGTDPFSGGSNDWLGALTYNTGLIQNKPGSDNQYMSTFYNLGNPNLDNQLEMREKGSIDTYDFNVGTTFLDMISVGASVSVTDMDYKMYSMYTEEWYNGNTHTGGYDFQNWLKTDGTGWQFKVGAIFKPIQELRIGVAYHSPTWYNLTDHYSARIESNVTGKNQIVDSWDYTNYGNAETDYKLRTPDKWVFSLAGVIDQRLILSADYELTNYKNMHLKDRDGYQEPFDGTNSYIKQDFKNASTLRVGAEFRITPQFSARAGYMWQQSPAQDSFKDSNETANSTPDVTIAATEGTITQYSIVGDANYFTWGLGYRINENFYTDVAFIIKDRKDDLYTYGGANKAELKNNMFSGVLTLGYKF